MEPSLPLLCDAQRAVQIYLATLQGILPPDHSWCRPQIHQLFSVSCPTPIILFPHPSASAAHLLYGLLTLSCVRTDCSNCRGLLNSAQLV